MAKVWIPNPALHLTGGQSTLEVEGDTVGELVQALERANLSHVKVVVGGIVPDQDEQELLECGVSRVFHPGTPMDDITTAVSALAQSARDDAPAVL